MPLHDAAPAADAEAEPAFEMTWAMRGVILILALVSTLNFIDRQIISILAEAIKIDLRLSDNQIGLLTGLAFTVFYLPAQPARGADRRTSICGTVTLGGCF